MVEEIVKLQAGITALSTGGGSIAVDPEVLKDLFEDPSPSIQMSDVPLLVVVHSLRQQVEFKIQPGKTEIMDMSETQPYRPEFPQICARVYQWMSDQEVEWRAHGWNFGLTWSTGETSAGELTRSLLKDTPRLPSNLTGAGLSLNYQFQKARVTLKLEPRGGKVEVPEVFASGNYHIQDGPPQTAEEIGAMGTEMWGDFVTAVGRLIEKGE